MALLVCGNALLWCHQNKVPHRAFLRTCDVIGDCLLNSLRTKSISKGEIKYLDVVRSLNCIVPHKLETNLDTKSTPSICSAPHYSELNTSEVTEFTQKFKTLLGSRTHRLT